MEVHLSDDLLPYLRSDHAGETGAVELYRGLIRGGRDPIVTEFARRHLAAEEKHLAGFAGLLEGERKTFLLPLWRVGGRAASGILSLLGPRAVFEGVAAVEEGVVRYFRGQIARLSGREDNGALVAILEEYISDEALHRDEAERALGTKGPALKIFGFMIRIGGAAFAAITRRI